MNPDIKKFDLTQEYYFNEGCYITELSNSSDDPSVSIARARVEAGETTRWHSLNGITERYVIIEGTGLVEVGDIEAVPVTEGDVVIIPPDVRQRISNNGQQSLVFLAICSPRFETSAYIDLSE